MTVHEGMLEVSPSADTTSATCARVRSPPWYGGSPAGAEQVSRDSMTESGWSMSSNDVCAVSAQTQAECLNRGLPATSRDCPT